MSCSEPFLVSMGDVVAVLLAALVLLVLVARKLGARWGAVSIRRLAADEEGVAYTLSTAISIPFYVLMVATVIECTLLMLTKVGVMYAAFAAARAASVWYPCELTPMERSRRETMVHLAAAQALTPFAPSRTLFLEPTGRPIDSADEEDQTYWQAYHDYSDGGWAPLSYLSHKRQYALAATQVEITDMEGRRQRDGPVRPIVVKVSYEKPIDMVVLGGVFGSKAPWPGSRFYSRRLEARWAIQLEGPKTTARTLGISYDPWND